MSTYATDNTQNELYDVSIERMPDMSTTTSAGTFTVRM